MAAVPIQIDGVFYPHAKNMAPIKGTMLGHASIYGLGVGGGPITPPDAPNGGGEPGYPAHPIYNPPIISGPPGPWPSPPIYLPPIPVPPDTPNLPPPGSPPVHIANTQPVQPMTPPQAVLIDYPGLGKVLVPQPTQSVQIPIPTPPQPTPA